MLTIYYTLIAILFFTVTLDSYAETWHSELVNGSKAQADSQTRKPTANLDGISTPLWDGVHTLEDGSIVIVRNGVIVPNEAIYHAWSAADHSQTEQTLNECEILTRRVCGLNNSCTGNKACSLAQQLQKLWETDPDADNALFLNGKNECHKALINSTAFPPCEKEAKPPIACARLVTQACGDKEECKNKAACDAARQLLKLAREAVGKNLDPVAAPEQYCYDAMNNHFFAACHKTP